MHKDRDQSKSSLTWGDRGPLRVRRTLKHQLQPSALLEPRSQLSARGQEGQRVTLSFLSAPRLPERSEFLWDVLKGVDADPGSFGDKPEVS